MTDPKRLSLTCDSDLERMLLRAGRAGAPEGARDRALVAASAALAASSVAVGALAAGNAAAGLKASSLAALKWVGVIGIASASVVTGAALVRHAHHAAAPPGAIASAASPSLGPPARTALESLAPTPAASAGPEIESATPPRVSATPPLAATHASPKAADTAPSTLPAEVAMLERARAAMNAGELSRALSILDGYIDRFPRGAMAPEAAVLRIETLLKAGDRAAATRFANAFLAIAPHSPYAARVQSLLAASHP